MRLNKLKGFVKDKYPCVFERLKKFKGYFSRPEPGSFSVAKLNNWSNVRLISVMRNDAHRIEKSVYSGRIVDRHDFYSKRRDQVLNIIDILTSRGINENEPTLVWAKEICDSFDNLYDGFVDLHKSKPREFVFDGADSFLNDIKLRRSTRVWSAEQPSNEVLSEIARNMIDAARWAPSSGNRQAWRFSIMVDDADKMLLYKIKEAHCYKAPLAIFVGMDKDAFIYEDTNVCMYVDAGMAMMNMVLYAHGCGLGTVVNHFGLDLVNSRRFNKMAYSKMKKALGISDSIVPVAIVNVGIPDFIPPTPLRADVDSLIIGRK